MDRTLSTATSFPLSLLTAILVTAFLFSSLPLLTRIPSGESETSAVQPILLPEYKPPPPPSEESESPETMSPMEKKVTPKTDRPRLVRPAIDLRGIPAIEGPGTIQIDLKTDLADMGGPDDTAYLPHQVDQPPRILRSFPPQYPYIAKRDNTEGWVILEFVVGKNGGIGPVEVVKAQPEGLFEEAALKAVSRYRFKPAMNNGEPVSCIVRQRLLFQLK